MAARRDVLGSIHSTLGLVLCLTYGSACGSAAAPAGEHIDQDGPSVSSQQTPVSSREASRQTPANGTECPNGMTLIDGNYCPDVEHTCLKWLDPPDSPYAQFRCAKYQSPAKCKSPRRSMHYCIDTKERGEPGSPLPAHFVSFNDAAKACAADGARICKESEWEFACEGEEMRPYPYGWERKGELCNAERTENLGRIGNLVDHRAVSGSYPACKSAFGVFDQAGNVEEWVQPDTPKMGWKQVMKGSWWIPSRHACRSFQVGHGPEYGGGESGYRCCKDAARTLASSDAPVDALSSHAP